MKCSSRGQGQPLGCTYYTSPSAPCSASLQAERMCEHVYVVYICDEEATKLSSVDIDLKNLIRYKTRNAYFNYNAAIAYLMFNFLQVNIFEKFR